VRGVDWQSIGKENFAGLCNQYKYYGKAKFMAELSRTYGLPIPSLQKNYIYAIEKSETVIHTLPSIQLPKPLKKISSEAFLELVSKLAEK
jgi:hypothetical protein